MALAKTLALFAAGLAGCSAVPSASRIASAGDRLIQLQNVELRYAARVSDPSFRDHNSRDTWDELYGTVWIRVGAGPANKVAADPEHGYFVASPSTPVSASGSYVVLNQLLVGTVSDGETSKWHEVASCVFVDAASARVLVQETGEICGGEFIDDTTWVSGSGRSLNLAEEMSRRSPPSNNSFKVTPEGAPQLNR
jgi:hypothetical protein